jgi:hypothetical protein
VNTIDLLTPIVYLLAFPSRHVLYLWDDYIRDAPAWFADANTGFVSLTEWADDGGEMVLGGLTPSGAKLAAQREEQGARAIAAFEAGLCAGAAGMSPDLEPCPPRDVARLWCVCGALVGRLRPRTEGVAPSGIIHGLRLAGWFEVMRRPPR